MSNLNGIFNSGLSGIIEEQTAKLPDYLSKLAESEKDIQEPAKIESENLDFSASNGLVRSELNDHTNFLSSTTKKDAASDDEIKASFENLLAKSVDLEKIPGKLEKDFSKEQVNKFLESNRKYVLNKVADHIATYFGRSIEESPEVDFKLTEEIFNSKTANGDALFIIRKFAKYSDLQKEKIASFEERLKVEHPLNVVFEFITASRKEHLIKAAKEVESLLKRNETIKDDSSRKVEVLSNKKNEEIKKEAKLHEVFAEFRSLAAKTTDHKFVRKALTEKFNEEVVSEFFDKFAEKINEFVKYAETIKRNAFKGKDVLANQEHSNIKEINVVDDYQPTIIRNYAYDLLTKGSSLESMSLAIVKKFGSNGKKFIDENKYRLNRHYGQLGYVFIDSNIYEDCQKNDLKNAYTEIKHIGKNLLQSVKASEKCPTCKCNENGHCNKVNLMISNHPLISSEKAASKFMEKAASVLPQNYIGEFKSKITENNTELISQFTLGAKQSTILARADKNEDLKVSLEELTPSNIMDVDIFRSSSNSKIVDDLLK